MQKIIFKILVLLILLGNTGFGEYIKKNGRVFYRQDEFYSDLEEVTKNFQELEKDGDFYELLNVQIFPADVDTFQDINREYGKDKDRIYYGKNQIYEADLESFEIVKSDISRDKNFVYRGEDRLYVEDENEIEENKKKWVDPATLRIFNSPSKYIVCYVGDKNGIYYALNDAQKIKGADFNTFEELGHSYAKDKNGIYFENRKIKGADVSSFEVLEDGYAKDKSNIYLDGKKVKGTNKSTFKIPSENETLKDRNVVGLLEVDKNNVYNVGEPLNISPRDFSLIGERNDYVKNDKGVYFIDVYNVSKPTTVEKLPVNPDKFNIIKKNYLKDDKIIYYNNNGNFKVEGADAETFQELTENYGKDKNYIYFGEQKIENSDSSSAKAITDIILKDKNNVYYIGQKMDEIADAATFEAISSVDGLNGFYAKDKVNIYFISAFDFSEKVRKLEGLNVNKTKVLNDYFVKDEKAVYCIGEKLEGVDAVSFRVKNGYSSQGKDRNHKYEYCKIVK